MPPLEAWEKVFISDAKFAESTHGKMGCVACHGGDKAATDKEAAHKNVVRDPTHKPDQVCGACHANIVQTTATSLHTTQNGYWTYLKNAGANVDDPKLKEAFNNHCADCHTTCAQCHISRPAYTGSGLLAGHTIKKVASLRDTCMACHGARVGDEYQGNYENIPGDVHWVKLGMPCVKCHSQAALHGDGQARADMYDKPTTLCTNCHANIKTDNKIVQHTLHANTVACQVCHSAGAYKNCANCHVGKDDKGLSYRHLDPSWMDFKIGRNPNPTADNPFKFVLVRHVPTNADIFKFYGITLTKSNTMPSWQPTTPHNIQRKTPQNATCDSCHGNANLFLTADKVEPNEREANKTVIVPTVPAKKGP